MTTHRIRTHPILSTGDRDETIDFRWKDHHLTATPGEMIASALMAHGIRVFGHHPRDGAPQGLFCANGQCAQCMVLADGRPVKACVTPVRPGMHVAPLEDLPTLPYVEAPPSPVEGILPHSPPTLKIPALILGGGPAGLSAAIELGEHQIPCLLIDDKEHLGGKLVLQTHRFFGSVQAVHAGTRGIEIARKLAEQVEQNPQVSVWRASTALAVFSDHRVGILRADPPAYHLVEPQVLIVATGARERSLVFPGNTLPGVYGAGAFQTLVNRDLVRPAERLFIVGGGNVGLIAAYHALQAGIEVVGLAEVLPQCGGYKVHADKVRRLGVPIYTSHTVIKTHGDEGVTAITIAQVDEQFEPIPDTYRTCACDTVLIAVGLDPVDEFTDKARAFGMQVFDAGDAQEIAEASAAMFTGKIAGRRAAQALGLDVPVPEVWEETAAILKSHPGAITPRATPQLKGVFPVFHCTQEIPCNPCTTVCPQGLIRIPGDDIRGLPIFISDPEGRQCIGCEQCVAICPGLAITLVDRRRPETTVSLPYELSGENLAVGDTVLALNTEGEPLGDALVSAIQRPRRGDRTAIVRIKIDDEIAGRVAGFRTPSPPPDLPRWEAVELLDDEAIVCRCERVTAGEIRARIREGYRDLNELKAVTRAGMGACGGRTCTRLILRLFREAGIPQEEITEGTHRPLFVEVPLGTLAGVEERT